jgi:hypothetical protein
LFERIVLYDLQVDAASVREIDGGYEVTIEITAKQFEANGRGEETEAPLDTWFDVALFPETIETLEGVTPLSIEKHRLRSGKQVLTVRTSERPGIVALDPFHKRIERSLGNNNRIIPALPITVSRLSHETPPARRCPDHRSRREHSQPALRKCLAIRDLNAIPFRNARSLENARGATPLQNRSLMQCVSAGPARE